MIKFRFIQLKMLFEYSKISKFEIDIVNSFFSNVNKNYKIEPYLKSLKKDFYYNIIKLFQYLINCKFITKENKNLLFKFQKIIENNSK